MNIARIALSLPMGTNDAGAATVREYLLALLTEVWEYGEGFDGKRPFGNSGWESEVYDTLIAAGVANDETHAHTIIYGAIQELG